MPELPDVALYVTRLSERLVGESLDQVRWLNPFILRTASPLVAEFIGKRVTGVSRIGKRIVLEFEGDLFQVIHLMIAGRFTWKSPPEPIPFRGAKTQHAFWRFSSGVLGLTEASTRKRASIHLVSGRQGLDQFLRGGVDVFEASELQFECRLKSTNRTLKRALTDPSSFDGIGNAYSDEILFWAKLSPMRLTSSLSSEETERLRTTAAETLGSWRDKLLAQYPGFPKPSEITAFRKDFAVHGRFGKPCPVCGNPVQHIVWSENETNYCAYCQNEGRLLADRSLSRLLKDDWPRTLEEMLGEP